MKTHPNPNLGQTLFSLNIGNRRNYQPAKLTPLKVTKIGRKYFTATTLEPYPLEIEFHLGTWQQNSDFPTHRLYQTEQAYHNEKEAQRLGEEIHQAFSTSWVIQQNHAFPLQDLRDIVAIIRKTIPANPPSPTKP